MTIQEHVGQYNIIGTNQDDSNHRYKGILTLTFDTENKVIARWLINNEQEQTGLVFFKRKYFSNQFSISR